MENVDFIFNNFLIHTLCDNDNDNCEEIQHLLILAARIALLLMQTHKINSQDLAQILPVVYQNLMNSLLRK